jgi:seryl-tRNA synthetase
MLDLKWVVANLPEARRRLATRNAAAADALAPIEALSVERKQLILASETERAEQKKASEQMRVLKGDEQAALRARLKALSDGVKEKDALLKGVEDQIGAVLMTVPNLPHDSVPVGTEADNKVIREWGTKPEVPNAKDHVEVGEKLGMLDFERAAKVSGARFVFYKGALARLELAVVQFFLENARQRGYLELIPPYLVNADSMRGTGQLPKFEEDLFKTTSGYYLIPTAEVPVTNYHRDEILESLPLHYAAFSPCFRSEAGSAGKDTKGIIRQHQFHKVELVRFEKAENAQSALEQLVLDAQAPLQQLGLHHRVVLLSTGDMSFASEKTYDLEVWLPGQSAFREISSCSSFGEFQARRAQIRFRPAPGEKPRFAATLNGSGLAVGRTVVAILENGQQPDGSVVLPEAIRPYMGGMDRLVPR